MQASAAALWLNSFFAVFDQTVSSAVHGLFDLAGGFFTPFFEFISLLGKGGVVLSIIAITLMYFKKTRRLGFAMGLGMIFGLLITNCCLKIFVARPRPYTDGTFFWSMWHELGEHTEADLSFPSGHTTAAFASMFPVFLLCDKRKSWMAFIFSLLMGTARIYLVVHYPSDVLGGAITGSLTGILGTYVSGKIPRSIYEAEARDLLSWLKGKHKKTKV